VNRFFCAMAARDRHEAVLGTASRIDRWLLVEAPGAWGPRALPQSRTLDDGVLLALQQKAKQLHARTLLIRKPDRSTESQRRWVFIADSRPGHETLLGRQVTDAELSVLELPFDGPSDGWERAQTLVGVCTHGRHDACCATHGRPAAAAVAAAHPAITWETSHLGGDRFAANAIVLPEGHYLGHLPADRAAQLVDRILLGERPDPFYRGRSCWSPVVQAALAFAATELGEPRTAALRPGPVVAAGVRRWKVRLDLLGADTRPVLVELEQQQGPESSLLTCRAASELPVPRWHFLGLELLDLEAADAT
jgi:hypothetical protein